MHYIDSTLIFESPKKKKTLILNEDSTKEPKIQFDSKMI